MGSIYSTQIRMHLSIKVFVSFDIYTVIYAYVKSGKLTALEYQYSDNHVKCYTMYST